LCQVFGSHSGADEYGGVLGNDTLVTISVAAWKVADFHDNEAEMAVREWMRMQERDF
jgi:hypothetical protein